MHTVSNSYYSLHIIIIIMRSHNACACDRSYVRKTRVYFLSRDSGDDSYRTRISERASLRAVAVSDVYNLHSTRLFTNNVAAVVATTDLGCFSITPQGMHHHTRTLIKVLSIERARMCLIEFSVARHSSVPTLSSHIR